MFKSIGHSGMQNAKNCVSLQFVPYDISTGMILFEDNPCENDVEISLKF